MKIIPYKKFSRKFHKTNWRNNKPNICQFELTFGCGLHCQHCYSDCYNNDRYIQRELNTQEVKLILDKVYGQGLLWLCFTGGDPLTRGDFLELYGYAKSRGFIITIFTNACSMNKRIVEYLKNKPPFLIEITLNAVTEELCEEMSGVKGSFSKVMQGIDLVLKAKLPLKIKTDVTRNNQLELPEIKKFIQGLGLEFIPNVILRGRLDGNLSPCNLRISPQEALLSKADEELPVNECELLERRVTTGRNHRLFGCAITSGDGLHIDPYGNLFPCNFIREPKVNLFKQDIAYARNEIMRWVKIMHSEKKSACSDCSLRSICRSCPGNALLETGKLEERVSWFCELAHLKHAKRADS